MEAAAIPFGGRLAVVSQTFGPGKRPNPVAPANFGDWLAQNRTFESLAASSQYTQETNLTGSGEPQTLEVGNVTPEYFSVLGIVPLLGRPLLPALLLCSLGIYGLLAQIVGHRTREIGVRLALGARPADVVRYVVAGTAAAVAVGALAGTLSALLLSSLVRRMLFGVSPTEPWLYAAIVGVMMTVALVAAWLPARRAAKLDPLTALRSQ